ncbi:hypothetical protein [Mucilaginibacter terrae]|uniref:Tetratricopeptide repeat protein n=1 Tax=Mucilaginibacter terrae TaxID=1955052 RepID=A0ABU3GTY7_9SPHI|nr:hypothetical protein [Mucilaginibacter terrae]MDT3403243.1 hypothetical protein [Mucilaginibacter terrae]
MRRLLLVLFCTVSFTASAQWWAVGPLKKYQRFPAIVQVKQAPFKINTQLNAAKVTRVNIAQSFYCLTINERTVMKTAQHQMRFREYADASYSFAELAKIYIQQNKLSEAKWFFLQSNNLSRQQNNDRLTIANLRELANIKSTIGDFALAQQDLTEAHDMASAHNWQDDVLLVKKCQDDLQRSKLAAIKTEAGMPGATRSTL